MTAPDPTTYDDAQPLLPYARLAQPKTATSDFAESSYIRLGSYVADESALLDGLKTTTSSVATTAESAETQGDAAVANEKKDPSKVYTATSQSTASYKTTPSAAITPSNNGILIFSDSELHENVKGAVLQKYGAGHVTEVTTADAKYSVVAGKLDIAGYNGIFMKAGSVDANYNVTQAANLEITAGGYIKQTAYGPLDEITYGVTKKNFHGDAYDEFHGFKQSIFHGREHTFKMSGVLSMTLSAELVLKLSTKFELTAGIDTGIRLALDIKLYIGGKFDFVIGLEYKGILGASTKLVAGPDFKSALSDAKVLATSDMKIAPVGDLKNVGVNLTICNIDLKKEFAAVKGSDMEAFKVGLAANLEDLVAKKQSATVTLAGLKSFM